MSPEDDALREMAANRGCKLVRSRRRKPGGDYGRYGLKDAKTGREMLGFGPGGLTATREEVQAFLRGGLTASWKRSLIGAVPDAPPPAPPKRRSSAEEYSAAPSRKAPPKPKAKPAAEPPERREPKSKPKKATAAKAEPRSVVREARPKDSPAIATLLAELGYEVDGAELRQRLKALRKADEPPLVAEMDGVAGCITWHVTPVLHRPRPVGRITMLVVAEESRGAGIGTLLVEAVEARLRERGCGLVEVTSNVKRMRAHAFYQRLGYQRTSYRFVKPLAEAQ